MARRLRVLYLQHAAVGGSVRSLFYTVTALDRERWEPVVAFTRSTPTTTALFRDTGVECLEWPGIGTLEHTTADHLRFYSPRDLYRGTRLTATIGRSIRRTRELLDVVQPDMVHLNSVVLLPAALALREWGGAWIWHVREAPPRTAFGLRNSWIGHALRTWPSEVLFISEADRLAWVGSGHGMVVYNYVDLDRFHPGTPDARAELGIPAESPVLAYVGGVNAVKGIVPLLDALAVLQPEFPDLRCVMPGTIYIQSSTRTARAARRILPLLGTGTLSQRVFRRMNHLEPMCIRLPFLSDVASVLAAADIVVFPAIRAHFPRPAVEAAALGKPVVASQLPGIDEVVQHGRTGLLTPVGDPVSLAAALRQLLLDPAGRQELGSNGRKRAETDFDQKRQVARITAVYDRLCAQ